METTLKELKDKALTLFGAYLDHKTDLVGLLIGLNKLNGAAQRTLGSKTKTIWFRFFDDDTAATTVRDIARALDYTRDTASNREYMLGNIKTSVKENSLKLYFS